MHRFMHKAVFWYIVCRKSVNYELKGTIFCEKGQNSQNLIFDVNYYINMKCMICENPRVP